MKGLRLRFALEYVRTDGAGQDLAELHTHEGARGVAGHPRVEGILQRLDHLGVGVRHLRVEPEGVVVHDHRHPPADLLAKRRDRVSDRRHVLGLPDMEPLEVRNRMLRSGS